MSEHLPATIPSLTSWQPAGEGSWVLSDATRVVADAGQGSGARWLATELAVTWVSAPAAVTAADIELVVDPGREELGEEGFALQVSAAGVRLVGATPAGAFYASRALGQMLRQSPRLPWGSCVERPLYPQRGVTLCASQVGAQPQWIERLLTDMADLRLNQVLLESKMRSTRHPETSTWHYYTPEQLRDLVRRAQELHIEVIPEINSPGHMGVWLEARPELQLVDRHGVRHPQMLDLSHPEALQFYLDLVEEHDAVFSSRYWHMGADEYLQDTSVDEFPRLREWAERTYGPGATVEDAFTAFINQVGRWVRARGKQLRIWNDGVMGSQVVPLDRDLVVDFWYAAGVSAAELAGRGVPLLNANELLYWSRSLECYQVDCRSLWDGGWHVGSFPGGELDPADPALLGCRLSIWPDTAYLLTENEVEEQVRDSLRLVSQLSWSGPLRGCGWESFAERIDSVGRSPLWGAGQERLPLPAGRYQVRGPQGQVLGANARGQVVAVAPQPGQEPDSWSLHVTDDGYYQLVSDRSGLALAVDEGSKHLGVVTQAGARASLRPVADPRRYPGAPSDRSAAHDRNTQKWLLLRSAAGGFTLRHALSGQDLTLVTGGEARSGWRADLVLSPGEVVQLPEDQGATRWTLTPRESPAQVRAWADGAVAVPGRPAAVHVELRNTSDTPLTGVRLLVGPPPGWRLETLRELPGVVPPGQVVQAELAAHPDAACGTAALRLEVSWSGGACLRRLRLAGAGGDLVVPEAVQASSEQLAGQPAGPTTAPDVVAGACDGSLQAALDTRPETAWRSAEGLPYPHWVVVRLPQTGLVTALEYQSLPLHAPQDAAGPEAPQSLGHTESGGCVSLYEISVSLDGRSWGEPVACGLASLTDAVQLLPVGAPARYVRLLGRTSATGGVLMAAAGLRLRVLPEPVA